MTYDDLVKEGAEEDSKAQQASGSASKGAEKPSSDLKMALFEKASLKKSLYCSVMKRLLVGGNGSAAADTAATKPICLLEVKLANEGFKVTLVLLGGAGS